MKTCKDCLHYKACRDCYDDLTSIYEDFDEEDYARIGCANFTDRSKWMHLPCKVGDTFYYIGSYACNGKLAKEYSVTESQVSSFEYDTELTIYDLNGLDFSMDEIYRTRGEAENALKRVKAE